MSLNYVTMCQTCLSLWNQRKSCFPATQGNVDAGIPVGTIFGVFEERPWEDLRRGRAPLEAWVI